MRKLTTALGAGLFVACMFSNWNVAVAASCDQAKCIETCKSAGGQPRYCGKWCDDQRQQKNCRK